jgi:hypothetical protein
MLIAGIHHRWILEIERIQGLVMETLQLAKMIEWNELQETNQMG